MNQPTVAIIGATGDMGRFLLTPLLEKKSHLLPLNSQSSREEQEEAWKADIIILSVPQKAVSEIVEGITLKPEQLIMEICTGKKDVLSDLQKTGATALSIHPLNGPRTPWSQQKWVTIGDVPKHPHVGWFFDLLKDKNVMFHSVETSKQHDYLMSIVLGLPQLTSLLVSQCVKELSSQEHESTTTEDLLKICAPSFASLLKTYMHTVTSLQPWLRKEILLNMHPNFLDVCRNVFEQMAQKEFYEQIEKEMDKQSNDIQALAHSEELIPLLWDEVTDTFNLMNTVYLGEGIKPRTDLYVQQHCTADDILLPDRKVRVGIHGINGAFTDEAWTRYATEELGLTEDQYEIVELVHSENVLRAVEEGEVDRGIFAFANSGSGGYTASIVAMGQYNYELLASFTMPINMCILTKKDISAVHELTKFYGHPIALSQSRKTLSQRWPDVPVEACTDEMDTALSAKLLAEGELEPTVGVFASKRAAQIYDLKVLEEGVHHDPSNATAFAIVKKREL